MPIYVEYKPKNKDEEYEILGVNHDIHGKDFKYIIQLREIIQKAKTRFVYKSDSTFCNSIAITSGWNTNLANFNITRCRGLIDESRYSLMMKDFIIACNEQLVESNKLQFQKSRFDIMGSWTGGEIVLLVPKNKKGWK